MIFERSLVLKEQIKPLKRKRGLRAEFGPLRQAGPLRRLDRGLVFLKFEGFFTKYGGVFFCKMTGTRTLLAVRPADRTAGNDQRRGTLWCVSLAQV
jgi:hypothetical protein